jgi:hypothetical protein
MTMASGADSISPRNRSSEVRTFSSVARRPVMSWTWVMK